MSTAEKAKAMLWKWIEPFLQREQEMESPYTVSTGLGGAGTYGMNTALGPPTQQQMAMQQARVLMNASPMMNAQMYNTLYSTPSTYATSSYAPLNTYTQPKYTWQMSDYQMERLCSFLADVMRHSWECRKCGRHYAPSTPDCEFCNLIERLEGNKEE